MTVSYIFLYVSSRPHRPNIRAAVRQQPVLTIDGWNSEYVPFYVPLCRPDTDPAVCVWEKEEMAPPSSGPAVGGSCSEEEKESLWCVCSCGSSSFNAAEDKPAPGNPAQPVCSHRRGAAAAPHFKIKARECGDVQGRANTKLGTFMEMCRVYEITALTYSSRRLQ